MIDLEQADEIIYELCGSFTGAHVEIPNAPYKDGKPFEPAKDSSWCKVSIQYADSEISALSSGIETRDWGIISIQVFTPKGTGTLGMSRLCKQWRNLLADFSRGGLAISLVHAPREVQDEDFFAKIVRAEFRLN